MDSTLWKKGEDNFFSELRQNILFLVIELGTQILDDLVIY